MKKPGLLTIIATFAFLSLIVASPVQAEVFKWVDEDGKTHYTNDITMLPEGYEGVSYVDKEISFEGYSRNYIEAEKKADSLNYNQRPQAKANPINQLLSPVYLPSRGGPAPLCWGSCGR